MRVLRTTILCLMLTGCSVAPGIQDPEVANTPDESPFNGTWELDVSRSTMQPGTASLSETIIYRVVGDKEIFLSSAVTENGEDESILYMARDDGGTYPGLMTILAEPIVERKMTMMVRQIDDRTRERYNVVDGQPTIASRRIVSEDGQTLIITIVGTDGDGRESIYETRVFDKQ